MDYTKRIFNKPIRYATIIIAALALGGLIINHFSKSHRLTRAPQQVIDTQTLTIPAQAPQLKTADHPKTHSAVITVKRGETLASIFQQHHLPNALLADILQSSIAAKHLNYLHPGQTFKITTTQQGRFLALIYQFSHTETLSIKENNNRLIIEILKKPMTVAIRYKSGIIHHSLAQATARAGFTASMQHQLNTLFEGTINFEREIHPGDQFSILYNEYYSDGVKDHPGSIIAAEIVSRHKHYRVIEFSDPKHHVGFYTPNGRAVKPLFLKVPLKYKRISSYFSYHRMDPVLHRIHPHLGLDYAAPIGTPVKAIGNGRILFRGRERGYGNTVVIRYNSTYKTLYGHLKKFAKHLKNHEYVHKGQVVAYVGDTGWSTGPHLHFEIYKNGKPVNPLTLKFPHSSPLPHKYRHQFLVRANYLLAEMHLFRQAKLANHQHV